MTGDSSAPTLPECLHEYGLSVRGVTHLDAAEIETYGLDADNRELALIGNVGSSYWPHFSASPEFSDGIAHPLDRWSQRIATEIAKRLSLDAIYPFEGPPYYPFQQWAKRAEALEQSPIGVMMHPEFGLWHSYRFALLGADMGLQATSAVESSPCLSCIDKPCLHSCPVDAFDANGYAVERCASYLNDTPQAECHLQGCIARYACPVAPGYRYAAAQGSFHLRAFLQAR